MQCSSELIFFNQNIKAIPCQNRCKIWAAMHIIILLKEDDKNILKQRNWSQNKKLKIFPPNIAKKEREAVAKSSAALPPHMKEWKKGK